MMLFLICSDLLNCFRSVGIMVILQKVAKTASSHFHFIKIVIFSAVPTVSRKFLVFLVASLTESVRE